MSDELLYICEICQTVLDEHHCKAVCPNCGRMFDCSDLPLIAANAKISEVDQRVIPNPNQDVRNLMPIAKEGPAREEAGDEASKDDDTSVADLP